MNKNYSFVKAGESNAISDEELMLLFQKERDPKLFALIYDRYFMPVAKYVYWLTSNIEDGKDIAQNIFVKLYSEPHLFDTSRNFKIWLFSTARNRWKNHLRNKSVEMRFLKKVTNSQPQFIVSSEMIENKDVMSRVEKAINQLSNDHKHVVVLKYSNNLTIAEISELLHCSKGTVKSRLFYALKNLNKIIENGKN